MRWSARTLRQFRRRDRPAIARVSLTAMGTRARAGSSSRALLEELLFRPVNVLSGRFGSGDKYARCPQNMLRQCRVRDFEPPADGLQSGARSL